MSNQVSGSLANQHAGFNGLRSVAVVARAPLTQFCKRGQRALGFFAAIMTTESDANKQPAEEAPAATKQEEVKTEEKEAPPPAKQTKAVVLTGFGGPKYVRVQNKDQRTVGKGEIAIDVMAW